MVRLASLLVACCTLAAHAHAQDPAEGTDPAPATTELAPLKVVGRRPDPFAFRNPVEVDTTLFDRDWDEPPSIEEIGMRGGIVQIGINKGLELVAKGIRKLPGWQNQVIGAEARPPPLDRAQLDRALRLQRETAPPAREDAMGGQSP